MDSDMLALDCWVHGGDVERIFPVEIPSTKTIGALKDAIKNKKPVDFRDVDPDAFTLYAFPLPEQDEHLEDALNQWKLNGNQRLKSRLKLSNYFTKSDGGRWLIIVSAPNSCAPSLLCSVVLLMVNVTSQLRAQLISHPSSQT
jgi:hypothetical protein